MFFNIAILITIPIVNTNEKVKLAKKSPLMYHTIIPVTNSHDPIVIEGSTNNHIVLFNAGPANIEAQVWTKWSGKENGNYQDNAYEPNFSLELHPGNEKIISGAFIRVKLKDSGNSKELFAAVGTRLIASFYI